MPPDDYTTRLGVPESELLPESYLVPQPEPTTPRPRMSTPPPLPPSAAVRSSYPPGVPPRSSLPPGSLPPIPPRSSQAPSPLFPVRPSNAPGSTLTGVLSPSRVPPPPPRREDTQQALAKALLELRDARLEVERQREQIKGRDSHIAELRQSLAERDATILEQAASLAQLRAQPAAAKPEGDDLKLIRGIGPGFERVLQGAGVSSFASIAAWGGDDIARIAALLNTQPARITRGLWIEQARALATGERAAGAPAPGDQSTSIS